MKRDAQTRLEVKEKGGGMIKYQISLSMAMWNGPHSKAGRLVVTFHLKIDWDKPINAFGHEESLSICIHEECRHEMEEANYMKLL